MTSQENKAILESVHKDLQKLIKKHQDFGQPELIIDFLINEIMSMTLHIAPSDNDALELVHNAMMNAYRKHVQKVLCGKFARESDIGHVHLVKALCESETESFYLVWQRTEDS